MTEDIGPILHNWEYLPNDINVRIIDGLDGKQKLQMRLDLGLLQMELDGRPDGQRPHKFDTYLSYFEHKAKKSKSKKKFVLTAMDCLKLQQEAIQYYHRYLGLMKLGDFARVARDTLRNLRVFDFVAKYAENDELKWSFEQYRPYVIMMYTRAVASMSLEKENYDEALDFIKNGMEKIEDYYNKYADREISDERYELGFLKQWAEEIKEKKPLSERERLSLELEQAIQMERYEQAAILRDKLKFLNQKESNEHK